MTQATPTLKTVRLGSRGSQLALWQSNHVRELLLGAWPGLEVLIETISTKGDKILDTPLPLIGGKGLFTAELETALWNGEIDAAVHSLKDLPTESPSGLAEGAIPRRANPADVLVSRNGGTLDSLPPGATIGTSSRRRAAQLQRLRPELRLTDIRGNVPTRIRKVLDPDGPYDAVILAYAGLERLGLLDVVSQIFSIDDMMPAPGQGALGVQCRQETKSLEIMDPLNHAPTRAAVTAERGFLNGLGGGCAVPIAAYAELNDGQLSIQGQITSPDGKRQIEVQSKGSPGDAQQLGESMALEALEKGAAELLERGQ